ncbi:phospholipase d transphosphatidylase [Ophiostoma piceae UAMH 11346]|uniref:Phospholipase d transphosphatidylase n=1 Tax=Ophiostoma piceae (strain UAMH 11346) TaxID=1262450 RepID=S3CUX0_OPHP1|nr:phospholipase d transphosphatidylase [Ophiostoma piceae UAMH 11346]
MAEPDGFVGNLVRQLRDAPSNTAQDELPPYAYSNTEQRKDLLHGSSTPQAFYLGTGASIFASALLPAMLKARYEIILVTCFWAKSKSLSDLSSALAALATRRASQSPQTPLRVRICFSSRSLLQKLTHTTDAKGYTCPPDTWESLLGLPPPELLKRGNIDLVAKSLFFLPLSVMHPKFLIVDREHTFLPSCNVSWEPWLEDCIHVEGDVTRRVLQFYGGTWNDDLPSIPTTEASELTNPSIPSAQPIEVSGLDVSGPGSLCVRFNSEESFRQIATTILPSSHHRDPKFRPFFWQGHAPWPKTPLNLATMQLLGLARSQIYIQTPNITADAVMSALLEALARGVHVTIVTGENMMKYEQIVTAFTTTANCIRNLIQRHEAHRADALKKNIPYGELQISYFKPLSPPDNKGASDVEQAALPTETNEHEFTKDVDEPVQSHVKLTIVDNAYTVLGSGNMDRASFFTSQELGILFHSTDFASSVQMAVVRVLEGRLKPVYPKQTSS